MHNIVLVPFGGGTNVSGAVSCPANENRCILSVDTSQMVIILQRMILQYKKKKWTLINFFLFYRTVYCGWMNQTYWYASKPESLVKI